MVEAESFTETADLSVQVDEWIFRYYRPDALVFLDERTAQPFTIGNQLSDPQKGESVTTAPLDIQDKLLAEYCIHHDVDG